MGHMDQDMANKGYMGYMEVAHKDCMEVHKGCMERLGKGAVHKDCTGYTEDMDCTDSLVLSMVHIDLQ